LLAGKPKAIDLFCGCGGISVGLQKAGFKVIAGIDIEKNILQVSSTTFLMPRQ